jgi:hypothetical protein
MRHERSYGREFHPTVRSYESDAMKSCVILSRPFIALLGIWKDSVSLARLSYAEAAWPLRSTREPKMVEAQSHCI